MLICIQYIPIRWKLQILYVLLMGAFDDGGLV